MPVGRWVGVAACAALLALCVAYGAGPQRFFDDLSGMEAPEDVSGVDCAMCHGDAAQTVLHPHQPAFEGQCESCHLATGVGGHGALIAADRTLCLTCHVEQEHHYPPMNCWTSSCHSDVHGSKIDPLLNPSRQEEYPGFRAATVGAKYVGSDTCLSCHADFCESWAESIHSLADIGRERPGEHGCESCHGPGGDHWGRHAGIGIFAYATSTEVNSTCLACHKSDTYIPDYKHNPHTRSGMSCIACHSGHEQTFKHSLRNSPNSLCLACHQSERVDFARFSHHPVDLEDQRAGLLCTDCHNPHGGEGHLMLAERRDDLCFKCHADKQGPFVFAHAGYESGMGQGCFTCHNAHGSNNPNLLTMSGKGLCLQCHTDRVNHFPAQPTCWTTGCHSSHHGSNTNYFFFEP